MLKLLPRLLPPLPSSAGRGRCPRGPRLTLPGSRPQAARGPRPGAGSELPASLFTAASPNRSPHPDFRLAGAKPGPGRCPSHALSQSGPCRPHPAPPDESEDPSAGPARPRHAGVTCSVPSPRRGRAVSPPVSRPTPPAPLDTEARGPGSIPAPPLFSRVTSAGRPTPPGLSGLIWEVGLRAPASRPGEGAVKVMRVKNQEHIRRLCQHRLSLRPQHCRGRTQ